MMVSHVMKTHKKTYDEELSKLIKDKKDEQKQRKITQELFDLEKERTQPKIKNFVAIEPYPQSHPQVKKIDKLVEEYTLTFQHT